MQGTLFPGLTHFHRAKHRRKNGHQKKNADYTHKPIGRGNGKTPNDKTHNADDEDYSADHL